ncbi:hypothetical protein KQH51_01855 [bacterium]|nr:hypothetical protein [bacterium]MCB2201670.1 hypothetical protein [bacterium]
MLRHYAALACTLMAICLAGSCAHASANLPEAADRELTLRDSLLIPFDGWIIDSLIVDNRNIFDTDLPRYDNWVFRTANKLNIVTREHVIRRELLFHAGEPFSAELAREIARNLRSDYSIYDAWWEIEPLPNRHLTARLITTDRWSLTGGAVVQRNGDETDFQFGFEEDNFLGLNQQVLLQYEIQEADDNFAEARFRDRRVFGENYLVSFRYKGDPTDEISEITVGRPYYNLNQNLSYFLTVGSLAARRDQYDDNSRLIARSNSRADQFLFESMYRWGSYRHKTGLMLNYRYHYESTSDRQVAADIDPTDIVFADDSLTHEMRAGLSLQNLDFTTTRRINGFDEVEDVTLGQSLSAWGGRAFAPDFREYRYDLISLEGRLAWRFGNNLAIVNYDRTFWFRREADLRRWSRAALSYYNNRLPFVTFAGRILFQRDWRSDNSARLELGGASGLRGFPQRFRVGDRIMVMNLETRWFPNIEFLSVLFGAVAFTDLGRTWKPGQSTTFENFHQTVGIGLRISLEKASNAEIFRIDLSRDQDNRWELSFGTGQYF